MISHVHDCQLSVYIQSSTSGWPTKESSNLLLGVREHLVGVWGSAVGGFLRPGPESRCFGKGDWLPRRDLPCQAHTTLRGSLHCVPSAHPLKRKWDVSALQRTRTPSTRPSPNPLWVWFQDKITSSTVPGTGCFKNRNEGNGNPLQYSCLESPMDRGAWMATVHRFTNSRTGLKWLSMHVLLTLISSASFDFLNTAFETLGMAHIFLVFNMFFLKKNY